MTRFASTLTASAWAATLSVLGSCASPADQQPVANPDAGAAAPTVLELVNGLQVYADQGCGSCHCNAAEGGCNLGAPAIRAAPLTSLISVLREPSSAHPSRLAASTDAELRDLAAFLRVLADRGGLRDGSPIGRGFETYLDGSCLDCHPPSPRSGIGTPIVGVMPDDTFAALGGGLPCHPLQRARPPPEVSCSTLAGYVVGAPVVDRLTDVAPPGYDEDRAVLSYFLAFIAAPPSAGVVDPCHEASGQICTVAGTGIAGFAGDGGEATKALLYAPMGLGFTDWDGDGSVDLVIADRNNHRVRAVNLGVQVAGVQDRITTVAGSPRVGAFDAIVHPTDVAFDGQGALIVAGWHSQMLYRYPRGPSPGGAGAREVLGGSCTLACAPDGAGATAGHQTSLGGPVSVAHHPDGRLFVSENDCGRIREVAVSGTIAVSQPPGCFWPQAFRDGVSIETLAGGGGEGYGGDGGPARAAVFNPLRGTSLPNFGIALEPGPDPQRLYVADSQNNVIRYVDLHARPPTVHLFAGDPTRAGSADGSARDALFEFPTGVAIDERLRVYVADARNHAIRRIDRDGREVVTIVGDHRAGFNGDNMPARTAQLNNPTAVRIHPDGRLFIADTHNNRVRVVRLAD